LFGYIFIYKNTEVLIRIEYNFFGDKKKVDLVIHFWPCMACKKSPHLAPGLRPVLICHLSTHYHTAHCPTNVICRRSPICAYSSLKYTLSYCPCPTNPA